MGALAAAPLRGAGAASASAHLLRRVAQHKLDAVFLQLVHEIVQKVDSGGVNVCVGWGGGAGQGSKRSARGRLHAATGKGAVSPSRGSGRRTPARRRRGCSPGAHR